MHDDHLSDVGVPVLDLLGNIPTWAIIYVLVLPAAFLGMPDAGSWPYSVPTFFIALLILVVNSIFISVSTRVSNAEIKRLDRIKFPKYFSVIFYGFSAILAAILLAGTIFVVNDYVFPYFLGHFDGAPLFWCSYFITPLTVLLVIPAGLLLQSLVRIPAYALGGRRWHDYLQNKVSYGLPLSNSATLKIPSLDFVQIISAGLILGLCWVGVQRFGPHNGIYFYQDRVVSASMGHSLTAPISDISLVKVYLTNSRQCSKGSCNDVLSGHMLVYTKEGTIALDDNNALFGSFGGSLQPFYSELQAHGIKIDLQSPSAKQKDIIKDPNSGGDYSNITRFYGKQSPNDLLGL